MLQPPEARSMSWPLDNRRCHGSALFGIGRQAAHVLQEPCQSGILYLCHCRRGAADHLLLESAVQPEAALLGAGVALLVPPPVRLYREIKPGQEKSKVWCQGARPRHSCSYCHTSSTCLTSRVLVLRDGTRMMKRWLSSPAHWYPPISCTLQATTRLARWFLGPGFTTAAAPTRINCLR